VTNIVVAKASTCNDLLPAVEDVHIAITAEVPDYFTGDDWEYQCRQFHIDQANILAHALIRTLPGGTLDQLVVALLKHKASVLRVPSFNQPEKAPQ